MGRVFQVCAQILLFRVEIFAMRNPEYACKSAPFANCEMLSYTWLSRICNFPLPWSVYNIYLARYVGGLLIFLLSVGVAKGQSVLAKGEFYKLGITQSGIYKIDPSFLRDLGIAPASLDPHRLKIYGNGGGMLPQANDASRPNDLIENAIFVKGDKNAVVQQTLVHKAKHLGRLRRLLS